MIINIWAGPHCHNTFVASQLMKMSNLEYISAWFSILIFIRSFEKRNVLCRGNVRPSAFSGLFFNMLWDINLKLGIYIQ